MTTSRYILPLAMVLCACGCATEARSTKLDIIPGEGVAHVATVGMHSQEVAGHTGNGVVAAITGESGFWACVPALGIFWNDEDSRDGITSLRIVVDPSAYPRGNPIHRLSRFRGTLSGAISLATPRALTRDRVVSVFGEPQRSFDLSRSSADQVDQLIQECECATRRGLSASLRTTSATEDLVYPVKGIEFHALDNVVHTIEITRPVEPQAATSRTTAP
jgi:hypothetical protein